MAAYSETLTVICSMGGNSRIARDGDVQIKYSIDMVGMSPGNTGVVGTPDTGESVVTVAPGNIITTGNKVAVFWAAGSRTNMTVNHNADTSITILSTSGTGTAWPATGTDVWVSAAVVRTEAFLGTNMEILNISAPVKTTDYDVVANFMTTTTINLTATVAGGEAYSWASGLGVTNPIDSDAINGIQFYNNSLTASTVTIGVLIA